MRLFLLLALLLTGCSQQPNHRSLRLNLYSEPPSLDPRIPNDITSITILTMLYEGLTRVDGEGNPTLALAESIDISEDQLVYTFHLRESTWNNGEPVTAADFVRTWRETLSPNFPAEAANQLFLIEGAQSAKTGDLPLEAVGIKAVDSHTLQVRLSHPAPYFLKLIAMPVYFPVPEQESPYISNGPFQLTRWEHFGELIVKKNAQFWDADAVELDQITMVMIEDNNTELSMFLQGELDWAGSPLSSISFDALPMLRKQPTFHSVPIAGIYWYQFNTDRVPFNNVKVRRAFSQAIDRQNIARYITRETHLPAEGVIPPILSTAPKQSAYSPPARQLFEEGLAELGLTREEIDPIELSYNTGEEHLQIAQTIQHQWEETFGIPVVLRGAEWRVHLARLRHGSFQIARAGWYSAVPDPIDILNQLKDSYGLYTGSNWNQTAFQTLLTQAEASTTNRDQFLSQAETLLSQEMPVAPIHYPTCNYLQSPDLEGVVLTPLGRLDFRWAHWID